mgnify:FL=1
MRLVGTAECIGRFAAQLITYSLQITFWQDHVAIEYQQILALGTFGTIVATLARTRVLLIVIMYIHHVLISLAHFLARSLRAILYDDHLEVLFRLMGKAL